MAIILTQNVIDKLSQTLYGQQLILEIEGLPLFTSVVAKSLWKIGDYSRKIGETGLKVGGLAPIPYQQSLISLDGTTNKIQQQINTDKGGGSSVPRLTFDILDKNAEIGKIFSPSIVYDEVIGRAAKIWLNITDTDHPRDSIPIMTGIVDEITFASGSILVGVSFPTQILRSEIFTKGESETVNLLASNSMTVTLKTDVNFNIPFPYFFSPKTFGCALRTYLKIEDELMEYDGFSQNGVNYDFNIISRGQLITQAAAHDIGQTAEAFLRLTGNPIDLALLLYMSGGGQFAENTPIKQFIASEKKIKFNDSYFTSKNNIKVGDYIYITNADNGINNYWQEPILEIGSDETSEYIIIGSELADELDSDAVAKFGSQYNVLPDGAGLDNRFVDIDRFLYFKDMVNLPDIDLYIKDTENAKKLIEEKILYPVGVYSYPRGGRASCGFTLPPIADQETKEVNEKSILNSSAKGIKISRSINSNYFTSVVWKYNQSAAEDRYLSGYILTSEESVNRFNVGVRSKVLEAGMIRDGEDEYLKAQSRRILDRYSSCGESVKVKINLRTGLSIDVGDSVIFGSLEMPIVDSKTGERGFEPRLMEVQNKSLDIKTGQVEIELLDTSYDVNGRYSTVSPSSFVDTGSTSTFIELKRMNYLASNKYESDKWLQYIGEQIQILDYDTLTTDVVTIVGVDGSNKDGLIVTAITTWPEIPEGSSINILDYDETSTKMKNLHCFADPSIVVVSGIDNSSFTVAVGDASKLLLGSSIYFQSSDYGTVTEEFTVDSISGVTIGVSVDMGFTPAAGMIIQLIGFSSDNGKPYRII